MATRSLVIKVGFKAEPEATDHAGDAARDADHSDFTRLQVRLFLPGQEERNLFGTARLDRDGLARFDGVPGDVDTVVVEIADLAGRSLFGPKPLPILQNVVAVELEPDRRERIPRPLTPPRGAIVRSGFFRVLGNAAYAFHDHRLYVAPVEAAEADKLGDRFSEPIPNGGGWVVVDPGSVPGEAVPFVPARIGFDGAFFLQFTRPEKGDGWLYLLAGPARSFLGFVPDDFGKEKSQGHVVLLPLPTELRAEGERPLAPDRPSRPKETAAGTVTAAPCRCEDAGAGLPPLDVEETQLLDHPELFTDDPGPFCDPFRNPERVLGERRFQTVLRSEQPEIFSSTATTFKPIPASMVWHHLHDDRIKRKVLIDPKNTRLIDARQQARKGRQAAGAGNLIDWEDAPLDHQAISVAGGHVLEWSVRWRSNGYSLGSINHSTNLLARQRKRIMKIDFARRELARREEQTSVDDEVFQQADASRDYSDAVKANLSEWARGSSQSAAAGAAAGAGGLVGNAVIGGGAAGGAAASASQQQGGRDVAANEEQRLRDALRQYGESLRKLESTVVTESVQEETVEGVSEVLWNPNYCHSITIVHYEILRHLRVDTELAGVSECLFVPFPVSPFTEVNETEFPNGYDIGRIIRHRDAVERSLRDRRLRWVFPYLEDYAADFQDSAIPEGRRMDQDVVSLRGSIDVKLTISSPLKGDEDARALEEAADPGADDREAVGHGLVVAGLIATTFGPFGALIGLSTAAAGATLAAVAAKERERLFDDEIAPTMARRFLESLKLKVGTGRVAADFTFAGTYRKGRTHRVHFQVSRRALENAGLKRADLEEITVLADQDRLPPHHSQAAVIGGRIDVATATYRKTFVDSGVRDDLVSLPTSASEPRANGESALLSFPATTWEKEDLRESIRKEIERLVRHLDSHLFYYHRAIWLDMDPNEMYTILDGYTVSSTDQRSLASVLEYRPLAIVGNALVFRVARGAFVGVSGFASLEEARAHYEPRQRLSDPIRVSLPTGGLYSQTLMDPCNGCEEHFGSTDWVLEEEEITPQELNAALLGSRRQSPQGLAPSQLPATLINLQNTPAPPPPSGVGGALEAVTDSSAFRDMAGLAGTQANVRAAMDAAAQLASQFGGLAAKRMDADRAATARVNNDPNLTDEDRTKLKKHLEPGTTAAATEPRPNPIISQVDESTAKDMEVEVEQIGGDEPRTRTFVKKKPVEGTVSTGPEGMIIGEPALQGSDDGDIDLAFNLGSHLLTKPESKGRGCVEMSMFNFHAACALAGCASRRTATVAGREIRVPLIRTAEGLVDPLAFHRIWFTVQDSSWNLLPPEARGAGAPGALLYAGLADGPLIMSAEGWPAGLRSGAFLQLWRDEQTYAAAKQGTASSPDGRALGHSLIFIAYHPTDSTRIIVSDQRGDRELRVGYGVSYPLLDMRFVIGANLKKVTLTGVNLDNLSAEEVTAEPAFQSQGEASAEVVVRYPDTAAVMAELMSNKKQAHFGQRVIKTGDVYGGLLVVEPLETQLVYYDDADARLNMTNYAHFFQMVNLQALSEGASRAAWLEDLARIEFEFMVAVLFGLKASAMIGALRVMAALNQHPAATKLIIRHFNLIYDALYWFVTRHPNFALCLLKESVVESVRSVPGSVDRLKPHQLATLFGKLARGTGTAVLSTNVLKGMATATASTLAGFTALKVLPAAGAQAIDDKAAEIRSELAAKQLDVDLTCLQAGLRDLLGDDDAAEVESQLTVLAEKTVELHAALVQIADDL